jgi:hypothetical protein
VTETTYQEVCTMRTVFRLVVGAALLGALAVGASNAASAMPTIIPTFAVSVVTPPTIARGQPAVASISITNLTQAAAVAHVSWKLVAPKVTTMFGVLRGQFSATVPADKTLSSDVHFTVPLKWPAGTYTLTVTVAGAAAPAIATLSVT